MAPPGSLPMMETAPGPSGAATAGDGVGRLSQIDVADPASYLGVGGGARGVARRVTEEGDNDDEEGGFRCGYLHVSDFESLQAQWRCAGCMKQICEQ